MPLDPQVEQVLERVRAAGHPEYWQMTPEAARAFHEEQAPVLDATPTPVHRVEDRTLPGPGGDVPVRVYVPRAAGAPLPALLWLHGGGHVIGSVASYDPLCRRLALRAECVVASVDYRLAPEHKFPAAVEDSFAALEWMARSARTLGADPGRIAVGGDSAGGNLAAVTAILARDAGGPPLVFQLLAYPATAPAPDSPSQRALGEGYLLTRRTIEWFQAHYRRDEDDRRDFRYAPLLCPDLSGLPPALVQVAEYDPLHDEGVAYAGRLREAGNRVEVIDYPGLVHAFLSMSGAVDAGARAIGDAARALRHAFAAGG